MGQRTRERASAAQAREAAQGGQAARERFARATGRWFAAGDGWLILTLALLPLLVRLPEALGLVHSNALGYTGGLGLASPGFVAGLPTIDPNIGFTSQALGSQAAQQWFSGQIPWWNPYEGVGMPLAGEMQSAAFFPLTLLLIVPWGQTLFHLCLQMLAGVATYYLLRQLRLSRTASMTGAVLFEFNGVFAWLANAVVNPVPFLPLLLLGVERAFVSAQSAGTERWSRRVVARTLVEGWAWIAVALALSLLAGFPEVAYLDGLLAALWVVARLFALRGWLARGWFALKLGLGCVVGVAIAAPPLVAFADYLRVANTGLHAHGAASATLPPLSLAQFLHPYIYGAIFQFTTPDGLMISWGNIGGYLGATVAFLALLGVFARRDLALRMALLLWIVFAVGRSVGAEPFAALFNKIPLMDTVAAYRYANASWILAAIVLGAFAIDGWRGSRRDKLTATLCAIATLGGLSLGSLWLALPTLRALSQNPLFSKKAAVGSVALEWGAILLLLAALLLSRDVGARSADARAGGSPQTLLMGVIAMALTIGYFFYPTLANPRQVTIDTAAVRYLQAHSGYQRFVTLGPFAPNYGSYFDVASVNHNDVPASQRWANYVQAHLDPYANPNLFLNMPSPPGAPSFGDEVATRLPAYEAVGVKYVVTSPGERPFTALPASERPTLVYQDGVMWIYQTQAPAPLFSAESAGCQTQIASWTDATTTCATPATLVYRSLADAGWHATVNGHAVTITGDGALFQQIALPAGRARVTFWYAPPHATAALLAAGAGLLALLVALLGACWLRRPRRASDDTPPAQTQTQASRPPLR